MRVGLSRLTRDTEEEQLFNSGLEIGTWWGELINEVMKINCRSVLVGTVPEPVYVIVIFLFFYDLYH
jgi:hypothetical protein